MLLCARSFGSGVLALAGRLASPIEVLYRGTCGIFWSRPSCAHQIASIQSRLAQSRLRRATGAQRPVSQLFSQSLWPIEFLRIPLNRSTTVDPSAEAAFLTRPSLVAGWAR